MSSNIPTTALALDAILKKHILDYLAIPGNTSRTLPEEIADFMKKTYAPLLKKAKDTGDSEAVDDVLADLKRNTPSRAYLRSYYLDNQSICTRYINSIALFFDQQYCVSRHDPAEDFGVKHGY